MKATESETVNFEQAPFVFWFETLRKQWTSQNWRRLFEPTLGCQWFLVSFWNSWWRFVGKGEASNFPVLTTHEHLSYSLSSFQSNRWMPFTREEPDEFQVKFVQWPRVNRHLSPVKKSKKNVEIKEEWIGNKLKASASQQGMFWTLSPLMPECRGDDTLAKVNFLKPHSTKRTRHKRCSVYHAVWLHSHDGTFYPR